MTYYIIQSGHIQDQTDSETLALYSAQECVKLSGKPVEVVQTILTLGADQ